MRTLRSDYAGEPGVSVGEWLGKILGFLVLIVAVSAIYATSLKTALASYAANETTFGPTIEVLVPLLLGIGILFVGIEVFMPSVLHGKKGKGMY